MSPIAQWLLIDSFIKDQSPAPRSTRTAHTGASRGTANPRSASQAPETSTNSLADDGSGVYAIKKNTTFTIDASKVSGAKSLLIECSKPDYFFDQIEEDKQADAVYKSLPISATTFKGALPNAFVPQERYCELRVRALDGTGKPVGEYSEPTIIYPN